MLPQHRAYDCAIDLQKGTQAPFGPIYNLYKNKLATLWEYFDENLAKNFNWHSKFPTSAPILFVKKKGSSLRMCVDYRGFNKIMIKNLYPLPLICGLLNQLGQAKIYTKIDIWGTYNLLRIKEVMNGRLRFGQGMNILNIMLCFSALPMHLLFSNTWSMTSFENS
jgi:hypothetical protein